MDVAYCSWVEEELQSAILRQLSKVKRSQGTR